MGSIKRAGYVLTGGRWFLIAGLVFYSLMTTTPFVAAHSEWSKSGWVLGLIVDAAFIMALSAESTLAKHGVTELGRWPLAFRWSTGLASVFLNTWVCIAHGDAVGVAVHIIAPALVMLLAEVGPVYMAALTRAHHLAANVPTVAEELPVPVETPPVPAVAEELPDPIDVAAEFTDETDHKPATTRLSKAEASAIIEQGWRHKLTADEVAKAATRHKATVIRQFRALDAAHA